MLVVSAKLFHVTTRMPSSKARSCLQNQSFFGADEGEEGSKGLFSLPFMRRAQEKRKQAAQEEARQLLADLDGSPAEGSTPTLGRRNFGLQGGVQVPCIFQRLLFLPSFPLVQSQVSQIQGLILSKRLWRY